MEPTLPGWSFIAQGELAFDPYSLLLANAPQALQNGIGVPANQQALPFELEPLGLAEHEPIYVGFSNPSFWHADFRSGKMSLEGRRR